MNSVEGMMMKHSFLVPVEMYLALLLCTLDVRWIAQCETKHAKEILQSHASYLLLSHSAFLRRILHLAIIHEDQRFAYQLIQWFPKDVLDIQNNLYQVGDFRF